MPKSANSIDCPCGGYYVKKNKNKHFKTQKHQKYEEGSTCGECGVSTQGRKIRSLWNNTLCEKCGEESEEEDEEVDVFELEGLFH